MNGNVAFSFFNSSTTKKRLFINTSSRHCRLSRCWPGWEGEALWSACYCQESIKPRCSFVKDYVANPDHNRRQYTYMYIVLETSIPGLIFGSHRPLWCMQHIPLDVNKRPVSTCALSRVGGNTYYFAPRCLRTVSTALKRSVNHSSGQRPWHSHPRGLLHSNKYLSKMESLARASKTKWQLRCRKWISADEIKRLKYHWQCLVNIWPAYLTERNF
jgi:hypothetical protein